MGVTYLPVEKYRRLLVDYLAYLSDSEWGELMGAGATLSSEIDIPGRRANIIINLSSPLSPNLLCAIHGCNGRHGEVSLAISNRGFSHDGSTLLPLINFYLSSSLPRGSVTISGDRITLMPASREDRDLLHLRSSLLVDLLQFACGGNRLDLVVESPSDEWRILRLFDIEARSDLVGNTKYYLGLTNGEDFHWLNHKSTDPDRLSYLSNLKLNRNYECKFELFSPGSRYASFVDGTLLDIRDVDAPEVDLRDPSPRHLFPLCIHTKFSSFDGLYRFGDFVDMARRMGHTHLGVTDYSSVQSFSEMGSSGEITPIYGAEFELIPDTYLPMVNDYQGGDLYAFFDIETSGLNPLFDELTEVAIHKYRGFMREGVYHSYVRISGSLKPHIVELTRITDDLLRERGKELRVVLTEIKEFIGGATLFAHNGIEFDLPFLNAKYIQNGMDPITGPLVDTMRLSQLLFSEEKYKSHALGALCKRAGVDYDAEVAHSADYDVEVLWKVYMYLLQPKMESLDLTLANLNDYPYGDQALNYVHGYKVLAYIRNQDGVRDMYELLSLAHTTHFHGKATINGSLISRFRDNLMFVSAPLESEPVAMALRDDEDGFRDSCHRYDYVIIPPPSHFEHEFSRNNYSQDDIRLALSRLYGWCQKYGKRFLLNYSCKYLDANEYERYLVLIHTKGIAGRRHPLYSFKESNDSFPCFAYRSTGDLIREYDFLGVPNLLDLAHGNQSEFLSGAGRNLEVIRRSLHPPMIDRAQENLYEFCWSRILKLYGDNPHQFIVDKFRLEFDSIVKNNYSVIYWVSHLLVNESIRDGYLVGSRGSVGSSFIAYLLNISEVNSLPPHYFCPCSYFEPMDNFLESGFDLPDKPCPSCGKTLEKDGHNIPFETFLGFSGNKVPDIDLNFSGEYQNRAHNFLRDYFGRDRVFRAGTISAMAEKTSFAIIKTYMEEHGKSYSQGKIRWLTRQIIDVKRTSGQHPGGILIVPQDMSVYDFTPVNYPANDVDSDWLTTHFEFNDLHDALLKFDILGHDDPTTLAMLREITGKDPLEIPFNDRRILDLYRTDEVLNLNRRDMVNDDHTGAIGLPEFGTLLTRKIIKACQPRTFADLIRISGFSHGTGVWKRNIDQLIREGKPLNEVITCRDDIMIYLLRMGLNKEDSFNITESIRKGRGVSREQEVKMRAANVPGWYIDSAKKITYIFPKAHATAYVIMSWRIAYYKLYYPLAFYSVYFTLRKEDFDLNLLMTNDIQKIRAKYKDIFTRIKSKDYAKKASVKNKEKSALPVYEVALEFLSRGFKFRNIDVNESSFSNFRVMELENSLQIPFIVIDGLGEAKAKVLEEDRIVQGPFKSMGDFQARTKFNKTLIRKLEELNIFPPTW